MDISVTVNQRTIISATRRDINEPDRLAKNGINDITRIRDPKGVETDPTPPAAMVETTAAQPADEEMELSSRSDNLNCEKDRKKSIMSSRKFESGSGSGDQEICHADDGGDIAAKKRKTRRGKPKHRKLKPYSKQQYQQRLRCRANGRQLKKSTQPPAPYNTTQFLMEDHSDLPDLEQKLSVVATGEVPKWFQKPPAPTRTRDSSFSIDSDEDYFYSSPEDEEEFLTKEFSSAYEDLHAERLSALPKSELIQEYIQLEAKLDLLTKRLRGKNCQQNDEKESADCGKSNGTTTASCMSETELSKKLKICQQRIDDLMQQNDQLRRDIEALRGKGRQCSVSSVDSESDSDTESSSSCSCSDGNRSPNYQQKRRSKEQRVNSRMSTSTSTAGDNVTTTSRSSSSSKDYSLLSPSGNTTASNTTNNIINGSSVSNQDVAELPT